MTANNEMAATLFEDQIIRLRLKENWPGVDALRKVARSLGIELDRQRIRRAIVIKVAGDLKAANQRARYHRKRARQYGLTEHHTGQEFLDLLTFYDYHCAYCNRDTVKLTADHVNPLGNGHGGTNLVENIQILCRDCARFFDKIGVQIDHRRVYPEWFDMEKVEIATVPEWFIVEGVSR